MKSFRTLEVYKARDGWRWRLIGGNNRDIVADGGQGYAQRIDAMLMARSVLSFFKIGTFIVEGQWSRSARRISNVPPTFVPIGRCLRASLARTRGKR